MQMKNLSNKQIRFNLEYLKDALPGKPTAVKGLYSLPKILDNAFNGPIKQKETALQKIGDHMGQFLGLLTPVNVTFVEKMESGLKTQTVFIADNIGNIGQESKSEYIEEVKYAGLYRVRGYDHREITIVNDRTFYLIHFLSVLAHEVTHNYLFHHQVTAPDEVDSEILTDLAAIFLGFGSTILRGYEPSSAISCRLGYIDVSTIRRAIVQSYLLRDWNAKDIIREFAWLESHRYYFQLCLLPRLIKALLSSQSKTEQRKFNEKTIIPCNTCGQKLRVPNKSMSLKVKCPKCGSSFIVEREQNKI